MPAFAVLAHQQPALVARLVRRLEGYPVRVHVDARCAVEPFAAALDPGVLLAEGSRHRVSWGGMSVVAASLALFDALSRELAASDHLVLLSGQCYPLRPVEQFARYLTDAPFRQHCRYFRVADSSEHYRQLATRRFPRDVHLRWLARWPRAGHLAERAVPRAVHALARPWPLRAPAGLDVAFGSTWIALTAQCYQQLRRRADADVWSFFAATLAPDERFFHSLLASSPYRQDTRDGGPSAFEGRGTWRMANFHHIHPSLSKIYTMADREELEQSRAYFVRKVSLPASEGLLDWLDAR